MDMIQYDYIDMLKSPVGLVGVTVVIIIVLGFAKWLFSPSDEDE